MGVVKAPALSMEASGNIGGICFSRWRSLKIARSPWTGTVPNTGKQVAQQANLIAVAQAWSGTLNAAERSSWDGRASTVVWKDRFGDAYRPNGYQLYLKWNIRRKVMSLTIMTRAPGAQEWVDVEGMRATVVEPGQWVVVYPWDSAHNFLASYGTEVEKAGPYDGGGRKPIAGEWRFLVRKIPPAAYADNDIIIGKWYWWRGRQIMEFGDVGNWFPIQRVIT